MSLKYIVKISVPYTDRCVLMLDAKNADKIVKYYQKNYLKLNRYIYASYIEEGFDVDCDVFKNRWDFSKITDYGLSELNLNKLLDIRVEVLDADKYKFNEYIEKYECVNKYIDTSNYDKFMQKYAMRFHSLRDNLKLKV